MPKLTRLVSIALVAVAMNLAGCGQKGPLYVIEDSELTEAVNQPQQPAEQPAASEADDTDADK